MPMLRLTGAAALLLILPISALAQDSRDRDEPRESRRERSSDEDAPPIDRPAATAPKAVVTVMTEREKKCRQARGCLMSTCTPPCPR